MLIITTRSAEGVAIMRRAGSNILEAGEEAQALAAPFERAVLRAILESAEVLETLVVDDLAHALLAALISFFETFLLVLYLWMPFGLPFCFSCNDKSLCMFNNYSL